jgi:hypothetical protein
LSAETSTAPSAKTSRVETGATKTTVETETGATRAATETGATHETSAVGGSLGVAAAALAVLGSADSYPLGGSRVDP